MGTAHARAHGAFSPGHFLAALVDFGPRRGEIWGNSDPHHLVVHGRGDTWAEVTERSTAAGGIWQRLRYDWGTPGVVTLVHTEVPEALGGRGLGGRLARLVLEAVRAEGAKVVPVCPFIAAWMKKHPEFDDLRT